MSKPVPAYIKYARAAAKSKKEGEPLRLAARRFLTDLKRKDLVFRRDKVDSCLRFIGILKHFKSAAPEPRLSLSHGRSLLWPIS